jgi:MerR family transcriptional regulator/heat shock protein HspR
MRRERDEPRYQIGIVAGMLECHPQTLRLYEREGLIEPDRSDSGVRLYCDADIELLRRIQRFTQELGVNLAGVSIILRLLDQIEGLQDEVDRLRTEIEQGPKALGPASDIPRGRHVVVRIEDAREVER